MSPTPTPKPTPDMRLLRAKLAIGRARQALASRHATITLAPGTTLTLPDAPKGDPATQTTPAAVDLPRRLTNTNQAAGVPASPKGTGSKAEGVARFAGPITFENRPTGDGRFLQDGSLRVAGLPAILRWAKQDVGGHDGAVAVGRLDDIRRLPDGVIWGTGIIDTGSEDGAELVRQLTPDATGQPLVPWGVSVDLDDTEMQAADPAGFAGPSEKSAHVTSSGRIRGATLVQIPAFAGAHVALIASVGAPAVAPVRPPRAWFADPRLKGPTALVVTEEGRVYGHLATFQTCHVGEPYGPGTCTTAPRSRNGYASFMLGYVTTAEGDDLAVGPIVLGTRHASPLLASDSALDHYSNTAQAVADVRVGEDRHGIWVAGALRPDATAEQVRTLKASPLSGDWREDSRTHQLELVAALAVNSPGFRVPRPSMALVAGAGQPASVVGIGSLSPDAPRRDALAKRARAIRLKDARARVAAYAASHGVPACGCTDRADVIVVNG